MPFEQIGDEPLTAKIAVRLTVSERQQLAEDAATAGLSVSALVRARYFGRKIKARTDLTMINNLNSLRGQLKNMHIENGGVYAPETSAMLGLISDAIRIISKSRES